MMQSATQRLSWLPELEAGGEAPLYEQIVLSLERDLSAGVLVPGAQLPTQRELASALRISAGTVTRAYLEAERRGLLQGQVGRGTFVSNPDGTGDVAGDYVDRVVDLSINIVPYVSAVRRFASNLKRRGELVNVMGYAPPLGEERHRRSAAEWLGRTASFAPRPEEICITAGAQHAMSLALSYLVKPGDVVLCEELTFSGVKSLADQLGVRLYPLSIDAEGIEPEALERAVRKTRARVLYAMPTVHNPTARTMSRSRRLEVIRILKRTGVWLVEDDIYALYRSPAQASLAPLSESLRDQAFYVGGASKSLAPGLRTGFLVAPQECQEGIARAIRSSLYATSALGPELFSQWVDEGAAFEMADTVAREVASRTALARQLLSLPASTPVAPHLWLPMPELEAQRVFNRALRGGLALTAVEGPLVKGASATGLRVCLGNPPMPVLELGLQRLKAALAPAAASAPMHTV